MSRTAKEQQPVVVLAEQFRIAILAFQTAVVGMAAQQLLAPAAQVAVVNVNYIACQQNGGLQRVFNF